MKLMTFCCLALVLLTSNVARTEEAPGVRQGATFLGASAAGAALGGPLGLLAGGLLGAWYADRLTDAQDLRLQLDSSQEQLADQHRRNAALREQLVVSEHRAEEYARLIFDALEMDFLFRTNDAELSEDGRRRLEDIASFLQRNPDILVALDGHTDPRGHADDNLALSEARTAALSRYLRAAGIAEERIVARSHGESHSEATAGDREAYAMERVVRVRLSPLTSAGYAANP